MEKHGMTTKELQHSNRAGDMPITIVNDTLVSGDLLKEIDEIIIEQNDDITKHALEGFSSNELFSSTKTEEGDSYDMHSESKVSPPKNDDVSKMNIFKEFILSLEEQIRELKDEIFFLRNDSNNKSDIIKNLLAIIKQNIHQESTLSNNENQALKNLHWSKQNKDRGYHGGRQQSSFSGILDELMATSIKKPGSQQYTYHSFPTFTPQLQAKEKEDNENCVAADVIYGVEADEEKEKEDAVERGTEGERTEYEEQATSTIDITPEFSLKSDTFVHEVSALSLPNDSKNKNNASKKDDERYEWQKYSTGFATKILGKMGYKGKGLGKAEDGIVEHIEIEKKSSFNVGHKINSKSGRKLVYILSDSMLNQINEKKLCKKYEVKVMCHGGCTIKCMYSHLPDVIKRNPKYVVLHIGTNDCKEMTSDEVLCALANLMKYIEKVLPATTVIISQPTVRTDDSTANQIITNLNVKLRRTCYILMDNSVIQASHLGKKGLHLNYHGTKKMAINIKSLLKRL